MCSCLTIVLNYGYQMYRQRFLSLPYIINICCYQILFETYLPLKSLIKEVVEKLVMNSEKLEFLSKSTVYEDDSGAIIVATIPREIPNSKQIAVEYHRFRKNLGKEFVIQKKNPRIRRQTFSPKVYKVNYFSGFENCYAVAKPSDENNFSRK